MRVPRLLLAAAALALAAGCADGEATPQATVTETVVVPSETEPTATQEPTAAPIEGRSFDAGTIVGAEESGDGSVVLELDRWTVVGVDDAVLAREGVPVVPHGGDRFTNQNAERTYHVPVADDVQVVLNECVPPTTEGASPGLSSRPVSLEEFLELPGRRELVVLLQYTDGELTRLDTDARC
ncbi:MAG: hypothetical protein ACOYXW_04720 [Actinomycetota bacterium]